MNRPLTRLTASIAWLLLAAISRQGFAQPGGNAGPEKFSVADGLPDPTVNCLTQDEDGFLWIGTFNGLSRFDGTEFVNFFHQQEHNSIPGNDIMALRCLPGHRLLIATSSGLCLCDTRDMHCRNLLIPAPDLMFPYENFFQGGLVLDEQGKIWTGTRTCVYQLDTNFNILHRFRGWDESALNHARFIYSQGIASLGQGRILLEVQKDFGYANYLFDSRGAGLMPIGQAAARLADFPPLDVPLSNCFFDKAGNTWYIRPRRDSLYFFDHLSAKTAVIRIDPAVIPPFEMERAHLLEVSDNNAFIALTSGGLLAIGADVASHDAPGSNSFRQFLTDQEVHCVFTDKDGLVWIGSSNGLYRYKRDNSGREVTHFDPIDPKTGHPEVNGHLFLTAKGIFNCTDGGGVYYRPRGSKAWENIWWKDLPHSDEIWNIRPAGGDTISVATQEGVYWWKIGTTAHGPAHWPGPIKIIDSVPVTTQFTDHAGWVWMGLGRGHGVAAWQPATRSYRYYPGGAGPGKLPMRYASVIAEDDDNNLWLGGQDGAGLAKWIRDKDSFFLFTPRYNSEFDNGVIFDLVPDHEGHLWVGTAGGMLQLDIRSGHFRKFTRADGLSSNIIYCLSFDRDHRQLYIGTKNGPDMLDLKTGRVTSIRRHYGLPDEEVSSIRYDAATKMIYYNTDHELYSFPVSAEDSARAALAVQITGVTISGKPAPPAGSFQLEPKDNITVYFTAVNLSNGSQNNYFYRLNNSGNWIPLGHQRQVNLSNLASGSYSFDVRAQTYEGRPSVNRATLAFIVPVPFVRSVWFAILLILPVLFFLYLLYRYRISQILHMQHVRNNIATDLHDDIGSSLTNINILAELSHSQIRDPQKAAGFLERISEEVTISGQSLDDIVWSINTRNDSFEEMAARMRRYAAEVLDGANINSNLFMDERLGNKKLSMELRRDIYLIFKEAINNVHKHAAATAVRIDLRIIRGSIELSVADDGRGFATGADLHRNGLKNIRSRVGKWKGTCHWDSSPGNGTHLVVTLPASPSSK